MCDVIEGKLNRVGARLQIVESLKGDLQKAVDHQSSTIVLQGKGSAREGC
jgi:hypothetical protein